MIKPWNIFTQSQIKKINTDPIIQAEMLYFLKGYKMYLFSEYLNTTASLSRARLFNNTNFAKIEMINTYTKEIINLLNNLTLHESSNDLHSMLKKEYQELNEKTKLKH